jgi:hypothetical protein
MVGSQSALAVVDAGTEARAIVTYSGGGCGGAVMSGCAVAVAASDLLKLGLPVAAGIPTLCG